MDRLGGKCRFAIGLTQQNGRAQCDTVQARSNTRESRSARIMEFWPFQGLKFAVFESVRILSSVHSTVCTISIAYTLVFRVRVYLSYGQVHTKGVYANVLFLMLNVSCGPNQSPYDYRAYEISAKLLLKLPQTHSSIMNISSFIQSSKESISINQSMKGQ